MRVLLIAILLMLLSSNECKADKSCLPECFDKITVKNNEIVIVDKDWGIYELKYSISSDRKITSYTINKKTKETSTAKVEYVYTDVGIGRGERLDLIEWNGSKASFQITKGHGDVMPVPEDTVCTFTVIDYWENEQR